MERTADNLVEFIPKERARSSKRTNFKAALAEALLSYLVNISAALADITGKSLKEMGLPSTVYNLPDMKLWPCLMKKKVQYISVEAEEQPEISEADSISDVPFFVFCKAQ